MSYPVYAHTADGGKEHWQGLQEHLLHVARQCEEFARSFDDAGYAKWCGLLHDLGKVSHEFQRYLERGGGARVDHSTAGWHVALKHVLGGRSPYVSSIIGFPVAGHHAGLPNGGHTRNDEGSLLARKYKENLPDFSRWNDQLALPEPDIDRLPRAIAQAPPAERGFATAFFIRMLFSCLTDADYLDTEQFCDPERARARPAPVGISGLLAAFDAHMRELGARKAANSSIGAWRNSILGHCREAGAKERGLFSLTVPTGGGKTLSSLAFALEHAQRHGMQRIIYVIPFTSIIEQNAAVFEGIFGPEAVLQHHCTHDAEAAASRGDVDEEAQALKAMQKRLATENWDATLVVTTSVQFFESLYASRSSRCRKLHNMANSVIILDEAQMLPTDLLNPSVRALNELAAAYGSSIVLCTATQPSLGRTPCLKSGFAPGSVREIIPQESLGPMFEAFKRVQVEYAGSMTDEQVAARLKEQEQGLCVVNTRKHARQLFDLLGRQEGHFHLSALMYPAHRTRVLDTIRQRLREGRVCRVVSTSLVEAGVDVDFPVVLRALAGLDSIAQAAGRCNREGRHSAGQVIVFNPPTGKPKSPYFARRAHWAERVMEASDDLLSPAAIKDYFDRLYSNENLDRFKVVDSFNECAEGQDCVHEVPPFPFADVARQFTFIDDASVAIIVERPESAELVAMLETAYTREEMRRVMRGLQPYTVAVYPHEFALLKAAGTVRTIREHFHVHAGVMGYCDQVGLLLDDPAFMAADSQIF